MVSTVPTRRAAVNGIELSFVDEGDERRPVVVLCHGFPELAYSWRHQIPALTGAGWRVLAPDMRGYGESSAPE
jgi:pimeloyl-ACP methyl ester carboxylesterase